MEYYSQVFELAHLFYILFEKVKISLEFLLPSTTIMVLFTLSFKSHNEHLIIYFFLNYPTESEKRSAGYFGM